MPGLRNKTKKQDVFCVLDIDVGFPTDLKGSGFPADLKTCTNQSVFIHMGSSQRTSKNITQTTHIHTKQINTLTCCRSDFLGNSALSSLGQILKSRLKDLDLSIVWTFENHRLNFQSKIPLHANLEKMGIEHAADRTAGDLARRSRYAEAFLRTSSTCPTGMQWLSPRFSAPPVG